jgi:hypothetical protein
VPRETEVRRQNENRRARMMEKAKNRGRSLRDQRSEIRDQRSEIMTGDRGPNPRATEPQRADGRGQHEEEPEVGASEIRGQNPRAAEPQKPEPQR